MRVLIEWAIEEKREGEGSNWRELCWGKVPGVKSKGRKNEEKRECGGMREKLSPTSHGLIKWGLWFWNPDQINLEPAMNPGF